MADNEEDNSHEVVEGLLKMDRIAVAAVDMFHL
jgi:hypothetical protein